jgi:putative transposase
MILFGESSLRNSVREFMAHYHGERNHQGLGNQLIFPIESIAKKTGTIRKRQRLGGTLNYYCREAA